MRPERRGPLQDIVAIHRAIARLDQLSTLGPQTFGRYMQRLLAYSFESAGFRVNQNAVGVPDFIAQLVGEDSFQSIAVEAKTSLTGKVTIDERDLDGVRGAAATPVVAVLVFPSPTPSWLFVNANDLVPRVWEVRRLAAREQVQLGFDVQDVFLTLLGGLDSRVLDGSMFLNSWLEESRRRHAGIGP